MRVRTLLCKTPPILVSAILSLALIAIKICLFKAISLFHLTVQGVPLQTLSYFSEMFWVACLLYVLLLYISKQQKDIASLNHEIRNALQVIVYIIPSSESTLRPAAQAAVERMKRAVESVSRN